MKIYIDCGAWTGDSVLEDLKILKMTGKRFVGF